MSKKIAETYATISTTDLGLIDFSQIHETSAETIRKSLDGTEFIIKYDAIPTFILDGEVEILKAMNHQEALQLMATDKWSEPLPVE